VRGVRRLSMPKPRKRKKPASAACTESPLAKSARKLIKARSRDFVVVVAAAGPTWEEAFDAAVGKLAEWQKNGWDTPC
jgi:hypothetical protein